MELNLVTFVFELVNFLVLLVLLQRIVYRPLQRGLAARRAALEEREAAADRKTHGAKMLQERCEAQARELDDLREHVIREASEKAAEERARLMEQAREDAAGERARAQRLLDTEREAALGWIREMAVERGAELAGRLLLTLAPGAVDRALVNLLIDTIGKKSELLEAEIERTQNNEIEIVWAKIPPDTEVARVREALVKARKNSALPPRLMLREDPSLLAGVVLRAGFHVFDASVAGQIEVLRDRARSMWEAGSHG